MPYGATPEEVANAVAAARQPLTFARLREVNVERCSTWHVGFPNDGKWLGVDWSNAAFGELGEAANVVKKLRRWDTGTVGTLDPGRDVLLVQLGHEIADTLIYLDLLAAFFHLASWDGEVGNLMGWGVLPNEDWTGSHWSNAAGRAMGLVCGAVMAFETEYPKAEAMRALDSSLRKVYVLLSRMAAFYGIDLGAAVVSKFNFISEREGLSQRL